MVLFWFMLGCGTGLSEPWKELSCALSDCPEPVTGEDCGDGQDNDDDGLADCEDGDCFLASACAEDHCSDGIDGDDDGLIDCADEDCWGSLLCEAEITAQVRSGLGSRSWVSRRYSRDSGSISRRRTDQAEVALRSVSGFAEVALSGVASPVSCQWTLDRASWAISTTAAGTTYLWDRSTRPVPVHWSGFEVSSGCPVPLDADRIVPDYLTTWGAVAVGRHKGVKVCSTYWFGVTDVLGFQDGTSETVSSSSWYTIERQTHSGWALFQVTPGEPFVAGGCW